jgi:hypothetical protein
MGFGEKFKDLRQQAQEAVAEHRDQIQDAVGAVGVAADRKTRGKHTDKIAKFGQRASEAIERFGEGDQPAGEAEAAPAASEQAPPPPPPPS